MLALDAIERKRAVGTPGGWDRVAGEALPTQPRAWNLGSSAWRVGPGTTWLSQQTHHQVYVRAELEAPSKIGLSLSSHTQQELWIWLDADGNISVERAGESIACMGKIAPNEKPMALELKTDPDGLMVTRDNSKMICPRDDGHHTPPQMKVIGGTANIRSIGRDRQTDGIPLSPLWWMSGLMGLCFIWMAMIDIFAGSIRKILPRKEQANTPIEE